MDQKWFKVIVTYNDDIFEHGLWAKNIEEAREKSYFKWINADKREVQSA
jgi:hypothetical protein